MKTNAKSNTRMLTDDDRHSIGLWAAECAEHVLPLFEAVAASDPRPRDAVAGIRAFTRGELRKPAVRSLFSAAYDAAREVGDPAAAAAARAAGLAAATAFTHSNPTIMGTGGHVVGSAAYAALARELATGDPNAAHVEIQWAIGRASPAIREIMTRIPRMERGRGRLDELIWRLDNGLRADVDPAKY